MLKKYFKDESYNIMPCGVVAFQNDSTLKIISANDYYYSTYANGNFESLNICEEDKNIIADRKSTRLNSSHIEESRMPSSA